MITPLFSADFTTAVLPPGITFTRSGNIATRINASGLIELVSANIARFDYNPITLACRGLLIEEARQNVCLYSEKFDQAPWETGASVAVTPNAAIAPDGNMTAYQLNATGATVSANRTRNIHNVNPIGLTFTFSIWLKSVSGTSFSTPIRLSNAADSNGNEINVTVTGTWQRFTITQAFTATSTAIRWQINYSSTGRNMYAWGAQVEQGATATSYIPTTTAAVTRNADVATITGTNFSDWWVASQGGVTANFRPSTVSGIRPIIQYDDGTANEIITLRGNTTNPELYIVDGGTPQAQIDAGTIAANTDYRLTGWWATNDCKAKLNSGAIVTDTTATIPTVTQARIGSDGTNYLNGTIASLNYYGSFTGQIYTRRKNKVIFSLM